MAIKTKIFDIAEHLESTEDIRNFLNEVAETGDESDFVHALNTAARAMGMTEVAKKRQAYQGRVFTNHSQKMVTRGSTQSVR